MLNACWAPGGGAGAGGGQGSAAGRGERVPRTIIILMRSHHLCLGSDTAIRTLAALAESAQGSPKVHIGDALVVAGFCADD